MESLFLTNENKMPFMLVDGKEEGLVAIGGDLSPDNLIKCYKNGIFPWFMERNILFWFCPNPRMILLPNEFKFSRSLNKSYNTFEYSINQDFGAIIKACARAKRKKQSGTWINKEYIKAYTALHHLNKALSVEVWQDGELVGGLYGVYIKPIFFGESMFHLKTDASKAALAYLVNQCQELGIKLIDCQQSTPHLKSLGAKEISKEDFLNTLRANYA